MVNVIKLHEKDNVATALKHLKAGEKIGNVIVNEDIKFGHKIALSNIQKGEEVIKYGEAIGIAKQHIPAGSYVHTHNLESRRGRGDI